MPRVDSVLPPDYAAYVAEIGPQVQFPERSLVRAAAYNISTYFQKLGNVVWLNASNVCNPESMARRFAYEMTNANKGEEELSYELSFLNEATIKQLIIPFTQRNLDIVNMAIFQTESAQKQMLLIDHAKALRLKVGMDDIVGDPPQTETETETDGIELPPVEGPDTNAYTMTVEEVVAIMPTPAARHANNTSNMPSIATDKLVKSEFIQYLEVGSATAMPFFNHVKALANVLDHAKTEKQAKKLLEKLYIMHLLYLFEVAVKYRDTIKAVIVDSYMFMRPTAEATATRQKAVFKQYLVKNQRDEVINGGYVELIEAINKAERDAKNARAVTVVS